MVVATGRRYSVSPTVSPLRFGLLSAADVITDAEPHWQAGIEFQPDSCAVAGSTIEQCTDSPFKSPSVTGVGTRGAEPFTVYAEIQCSPVGIFDEYQARSAAALTNGEGRAVENVFWSGSPTVTGTVLPHLAEDTAVTDARGIVMQTAASVVTTGSAVDVVEAIGLLEGELGLCYGGEGVIHVPRQALAHLAAHMLVTREGAQLRTLGGNRVAAYSSNNKQGPTGANAAAGEAWFYATGAVNVRRTGINYTSSLPEALNRSENTMIYIAERTYVINWDCCHLAAQVHLGGVVTGGSQVRT